MKIALIMVKGSVYSFRNRANVFKYMPDSLTMGVLKAIIENSFPEIEVEIYDETVEVVNKQDITADIVGISAITPAYSRAKVYAEYFKSKNIPVFIGGVHATLSPEKCCNDFDSVIVGLANESLVELINDFQKGEIKPIYYQNSSLSFENFVHPNRTIYEKKHSLGVELNMVQATYGCSNVCEFCVQPYVCNGYHQRPVDDVIQEIKKIKDDYIEFVDPNLSKDIEYLKELCKRLIPLKKTWFAPMTISIVKDDELLEIMKLSGCVGVLIGFESVNAMSIKSINKGFNCVNSYKDAIAKLHKYGIKITGSFVVGLDGDTEDLVEKTLNFVNDAHVDFVRYTINTPYPGTQYHQRMLEDGRIIEFDYSLYDCQHCVIKPSHLSPKQVESMHKALWYRSYSFINICKRLSYMKPLTKRLIHIIQNYLFGKTYIKMSFKTKNNF